MNNYTWIKLYREIQNNPIWNLKPFSRGQAWVDLLLKANTAKGFIEVRNNIITLERGDCGYSIKKLSSLWGWSRTKTQNFLNLLEKEQQIIQKKNQITSIISIVNYEKYQGNEKKRATEEQQESNKKATKEQQESTNKNIKNNKNEIIKENNNIKSDKSDCEYMIWFDKFSDEYFNKHGKSNYKKPKIISLFKIKDKIEKSLFNYKEFLSKPENNWRKAKDFSTFCNSGYKDYLDENYTQDNDNKNKPTEKVFTIQELKQIKKLQYEIKDNIKNNKTQLNEDLLNQINKIKGEL